MGTWDIPKVLPPHTHSPNNWARCELFKEKTLYRHIRLLKCIKSSFLASYKNHNAWISLHFWHQSPESLIVSHSLSLSLIFWQAVEHADSGQKKNFYNVYIASYTDQAYKPYLATQWPSVGLHMWPVIATLVLAPQATIYWLLTSAHAYSTTACSR